MNQIFISLKIYLLRKSKILKTDQSLTKSLENRSKFNSNKNKFNINKYVYKVA